MSTDAKTVLQDFWRRKADITQAIADRDRAGEAHRRARGKVVQLENQFDADLKKAVADGVLEVGKTYRFERQVMRVDGQNGIYRLTVVELPEDETA